MELKRAVVVSKDIGGSNVVLPLAKLLKEKGVEIVPVLEGLASERFEDAGFSPYFKGTVNFQVEPYSLNVHAVLEKLMPDVVICSEGSPINLEQLFGLAANDLKIPLVEINDFWSGTSRSKALPNLICAMDEYDESVSRKAFPHAKVVVVGNIGVLHSKQGDVVQSPFADLGLANELIIVYVGSGQSTEDELQLLLQCLEKTTCPWRLVPRFHPKYENLFVDEHASSGETYGMRWNKIINTVHSRVISLHTIKKTEEIIRHAHVVCASFSTLLTTAACLGKTVVALSTPQGDMFLREACLTEVPQVALGCAHLVSKSTDFTVLTSPSDEARAKLLPYNPQKVLDAITAL